MFYVLSTYTIIEFAAFSYFIFSNLESKVFKVIVIISTISFFLFDLLYFIFAEHDAFDSLPASIESIFLVSYCIFYMFDQLNRPQSIFIYQDPGFWVVVGLMVYFSGTLFLFIEADNLPKEVRHNVWKINLFANIAKNILFAIAFSIKKSKNILQTIENMYDESVFENQYKI